MYAADDHRLGLQLGSFGINVKSKRFLFFFGAYITLQQVNLAGHWGKCYERCEAAVLRMRALLWMPLQPRSSER